MTISEARELVRAEPKRWRAAFVEGTSTPLLDDAQASVRLHPTISAASDELRSSRDRLVKSGYRVTFGNLGKRIMVLEREPSEVRVIGVDKPRKRG